MAAKVRLTIAVADYPHTAAVRDGSIPIEGVDAEIVTVTPQIGAFRRMVRNLEFDVCEVAPTTYIIARAYGVPITALPIFVMRNFHHRGLLVRPDAGIATPKDLEGRKVGVRAWSVTTGVWTRAVLIDDYGVDISKVTWVVDDEEHVREMPLPPYVEHAPAGRSLAAMMADGELAAGFAANAGIGRSGAPTGGVWKAEAADYPELFPNYEELEADWYPPHRHLADARHDHGQGCGARRASLGRAVAVQGVLAAPRTSGWRASRRARSPPPPTSATMRCAASSATIRCPTGLNPTCRPSARSRTPRSSSASLLAA